MRDDPSLADFETEILLPAQVTAGARHDAHLSGARALMLAVLTDAIRCLVGRARGPARAVRRLARDARRWVGSNDRRPPFSFLNVCDALGFDPGAIRGRLLAPNGTVARDVPRRLAGDSGRARRRTALHPHPPR